MSDDATQTPTDSRPEQLAQAARLAAAVLAAAPVERYGDPSPCTEYTVRDLANHLVFGFELAAASGTRTPWTGSMDPAAPAPSLDGRPEADWAGIGDEQADRAAAAWSDAEAWTGGTTMGTSEMPAEVVGPLMLAEFVLHGWDLARATGQDYDVPEDLAAAALGATEGVAEMGRDGGWYGDQVTVPADAPALHRALAASGRDPNWSPPASA